MHQQQQPQQTRRQHTNNHQSSQELAVVSNSQRALNLYENNNNNDFSEQLEQEEHLELKKTTQVRARKDDDDDDQLDPSLEQASEFFSRNNNKNNNNNSSKPDGKQTIFAKNQQPSHKSSATSLLNSSSSSSSSTSSSISSNRISCNQHKSLLKQQAPKHLLAARSHQHLFQMSSSNAQQQQQQATTTTQQQQQNQNSTSSPHLLHHQHHHHLHHHTSASQLASDNAKQHQQQQQANGAANKHNGAIFQSKSVSSLIHPSATSVSIKHQRSQQHQQQLPVVVVDRSDSASLPSSTSTSESMFKRRLRSDSKWHRLFACGSSSSSSDHHHRRSSSSSSSSHHHSSSASKRTTTTIMLLLLLLLLVILAAAVLFHFKLFGFSISCSYYGANKQQPSEGFNLKNGAEFYLGITEMLQAMDNTVDPCHDFYNYACGAWTRRHSIPGDESRIDTFSVMRTDLGNKLKDLLEEDIDSSDSEATIKAKTLYRSCVNESQIDKRGPEPLLQLLESQFGGWPLLSESSPSSASSSPLSPNSPSSSEGNTSNGGEQTAASNNNNNNEMNWVQMMAILRTYNNEIIIGQTVGSHEHNSSMHAIRLYPAGLGLPSADYYNSSSRQFKAYERYIISTAQLLKANNSNLMSDIRDLLEFESGLANISKPFEKQGGATYHRMTIARLQKYTPAIDWDTYFKYAFPDISINSTEQVGLYGLDFFMDIAHLINTTPSKKTVINYLLWRFVMNRVNNLGKQFANNQHEYAAEISGAKVQAPRHKVCVDYVNGNMGMGVSSLYVKRHFDVGSKAQAEIMIANIRQAFLEILNQVDWMDAETRTEAIVKAKSMLQHIGFPMWIIEPQALDAEYQHLNFNSDQYFENVIQLIQSFAKETRTKLRQPSERDKWTVAPSIINAHYLRTKNLMSFPAGILQPPIYHTRYPKSLNYGGIGSIIGHEITHGFDNDGRHHDYQGNQRLWWHPNTIDRFIIRSQCMVRQYDDYNVEIRGENVTVSGLRTLGENIADNGGLKEAFMAYRKYELENGPEDTLPGLNLTHHQMFFIKFAQNWCQNMTPQSMMNALKTWRHPLGKFRVMGTLSNLNEFSTAFNCPANTPMNPPNKCKVW